MKIVKWLWPWVLLIRRTLVQFPDGWPSLDSHFIIFVLSSSGGMKFVILIEDSVSTYCWLKSQNKKGASSHPAFKGNWLTISHTWESHQPSRLVLSICSWCCWMKWRVDATLGDGCGNWKHLHSFREIKCL